MLSKWPNNANRTFYPSPIRVITAKPITKPPALKQEDIDAFAKYSKEYDSLIDQKQTLDDKLAKIIGELDAAENVKGNVWSRKDTSKNLIKRLKSESDIAKGEILALENKIDVLTKANGTLISLVSVHESCVKGYQDYLEWKEETNRQIHETFMNT
jgi:hypothetical protein